MTPKKCAIKFYFQMGNLIKKIYTNIQSRGVVDGKVYIITIFFLNVKIVNYVLQFI